MVAQFIATQFILDLCEETERTPRARVGMRWWDKLGIDLTWARERVTAAEDVDADKEGG